MIVILLLVFDVLPIGATGPGWLRRHYLASSTTTGVSDHVGDIIINTTPTAGGVSEYRCTTAGSPGTWKPVYTATEGTWTPALTGTTIAGAFTYDTQLGVYTRVGDLIYVFARINITAIGTSPTGNLTITGLPFTCKNDANVVTGLALGMVSQFNLSAGSLGLTLRVGNNTTTITVLEYFDNAAAANFPAAGLNTTAQIIFSGVYRAE